MNNAKLQITFKSKKLRLNPFQKSEYTKGPTLQKITQIPNITPGNKIHIDNYPFSLTLTHDPKNEMPYFGHHTIKLQNKFSHPLETQRKEIIKNLQNNGWEIIEPLQPIKKTKKLQEQL